MSTLLALQMDQVSIVCLRNSSIVFCQTGRIFLEREGDALMVFVSISSFYSMNLTFTIIVIKLPFSLSSYM